MVTTRRQLHELNHKYLRRLAHDIEKEVRAAALAGEPRYVLANPHEDIICSEAMSILRDTFRDCSVKYITGALIISWN